MLCFELNSQNGKCCRPNPSQQLVNPCAAKTVYIQYCAIEIFLGEKGKGNERERESTLLFFTGIFTSFAR